jgi:hypothetical protein
MDLLYCTRLFFLGPFLFQCQHDFCREAVCFPIKRIKYCARRHAGARPKINLIVVDSDLQACQ